MINLLVNLASLAVQWLLLMEEARGEILLPPLHVFWADGQGGESPIKNTSIKNTGAEMRGGMRQWLALLSTQLLFFFVLIEDSLF